MTIPVNNDWKNLLERAEMDDSYQELKEFLKKEYQTETVFPAKEDIWQAFEWTPFTKVKVVLIGQDPYHGDGQAHGLSFSVNPGIAIPPSLRNMYKELENDLGIQPVSHGYLKKWAEEGVLLLNTVLTVRRGSAFSHQNKGWENLTDNVIRALNDREDPVVFLLWGNSAKAKQKMIDETKHVIITSVHPSPLSAYRGFFGSGPYSKANEALQKLGKTPIDWKLPENPVK